VLVRERGRGLVVQGAVRAHLVVVAPVALDVERASGRLRNPVLIQALVAELAVEDELLIGA